MEGQQSLAELGLNPDSDFMDLGEIFSLHGPQLLVFPRQGQECLLVCGKDSSWYRPGEP